MKYTGNSNIYSIMYKDGVKTMTHLRIFIPDNNDKGNKIFYKILKKVSQCHLYHTSKDDQISFEFVSVFNTTIHYNSWIFVLP